MIIHLPQHYAYNNQGWLTRAKYVDGASGTEAFTYDATGNRTNRTWTPSGGSPVSTDFTIAPYSDLVTQAGTSGTMDYTAGGNLIDDNWIGREYEWDQFNRVTMVKSATGTPLYGFEYGGTGERQVQNTYTGGLVSSTRAFLYDREDVIAEFSNDTFATLFRQYIHGPGIDEPLAILGSGGTGSFNEGYSYYLHDGLGSVTGIVDESGKLIGAINYSAFGETRLNTVKIENRYRYTSREFVETNLYYYRARHMRPDLGRFMSMDPLKTIDGTNMFGYVGNEPTMLKDPLGSSTTIVMDCDIVCHCYFVIGGETYSNPGVAGVNDTGRQGGQYFFAAEPLNDKPCTTDCRDDCIAAVWKQMKNYYHWFFQNCCDHVRRALSACNCKIPDQIKYANGGV